jgi:hypothetical protein
MPTNEHLWAPGIPARNLSEAEVEHYGIEALTNSQCYKLELVDTLEELVEELAPAETEE